MVATFETNFKETTYTWTKDHENVVDGLNLKYNKT